MLRHLFIAVFKTILFDADLRWAGTANGLLYLIFSSSNAEFVRDIITTITSWSTIHISVQQTEL
jgi:hypothetical protein